MELTVKRPDDWHLHLRDGALLKAVTPCSSVLFGRAMIMPNLVPPVVSVDDALSYRNRILEAVPAAHTHFTPYMSLYLTESTSPHEIEKMAEEEYLLGVKLYPAGATTNSGSGVRNIENVMGVLEKMAEHGIPLLIHGEVVDTETDIFDREKVFIEKILAPLHERLPELPLVLEHITTADGVDFIRSCEKGVAGTITVHHLLINRNDILVGGIKPHNYCLPIAKRELHRKALLTAATSGDPRFFFGSDSAPHLQAAKESSCGCAGCFTAPVAVELLAQIFDDLSSLHSLEAFLCVNGAKFYGLEESPDTITLIKNDEVISAQKCKSIFTDDGPILPFIPPQQFKIYWQGHC